MNVSTKTLEEEVGEKVNSIVWCKNFYPHSWCCPKINSHIPRKSENFAPQKSKKPNAVHEND